MADEPIAIKAGRERSPAYPFIALGEALERARQFNKIERKNSAPVHVAVKHWGYKEKSSGGLQTIAALKTFGLMDDVGSGRERKVKLSDFGLQIVQDERLDSPERDNLIKRAALMPKIHSSLWNKYRAELPSPDNLAHELKTVYKFNPSVIANFVKEYRDTISFAKLTDSDRVSSEVRGDGDGKGAYIPKIGDFVQWEPNGVVQFVEPERVRDISPDGKYAFVDGSNTGIPVGELHQEKAPLSATNSDPLQSRLLSLNKHMKEDVFSVNEGKLVLQWPTPLSADSIQDVKDWLEIMQRKIARSLANTEETK
jgi:hypothetical protein